MCRNKSFNNVTCIRCAAANCSFNFDNSCILCQIELDEYGRCQSWSLKEKVLDDEEQKPTGPPNRAVKESEQPCW